MLDTALMHHAMWSKGQWTLAAEVRLRVGKFGATPEDRLRLRWAVEAPVDEEVEQRRREAAARWSRPVVRDRLGPLLAVDGPPSAGPAGG